MKQGVVKVPTITLKKLMEKYSIEQFDLIKIDIEGGEYELLENIDWTISKQYSVEFHDFRGMNPFFPNDELYYDSLLAKMKQYCDVAQHEKTNHPGFPLGKGYNYWNSLFLLKKEYYK